MTLLVLGVAACSSGADDSNPSGSTSSSGSMGDATSVTVAVGGMTSASSASNGGNGGEGGSGGSGPYGDCSVDGNPGTCIDISDCALMPEHTSTPGFCPGPANIECCALTPDVADNPPTPTGYKLMMQSEVTPEMTTWAVDILHDPTTYPMFATAMETFGSLMALARVEWHPPDFQNDVVHRGVTLYEPI